MFEGRFSLALAPGGGVVLPPTIRKEMHRAWGPGPQLLCFGVQFLYVCQAAHAEELLRRIDAQLCVAFAEDKRGVVEYFHRMEASVAQVQPANDGGFSLPKPLMELLGAPRGGLLMLLGVEDHLELWNRDRLLRQSETLELLTRGAPKKPPFLLDTPICMQGEDTHCSLSRAGRPDPRRCGPCMYLRVP